MPHSVPGDGVEAAVYPRGSGQAARLLLGRCRGEGRAEEAEEKKMMMKGDGAEEQDENGNYDDDEGEMEP